MYAFGGKRFNRLCIRSCTFHLFFYMAENDQIKTTNPILNGQLISIPYFLYNPHIWPVFFWGCGTKKSTRISYLFLLPAKPFIEHPKLHSCSIGQSVNINFSGNATNSHFHWILFTNERPTVVHAHYVEIEIASTELVNRNIGLDMNSCHCSWCC